MGVKHARRYCPEDDQTVLAVKRTPNHILHLLLSVVTMGFWLIVWIVLILANEFEPWRCPNCGGKTSGFLPRRKKDRSDGGDIRITG